MVRRFACLFLSGSRERVLPFVEESSAILFVGFKENMFHNWTYFPFVPDAHAHGGTCVPCKRRFNHPLEAIAPGIPKGLSP